MKYLPAYILLTILAATLLTGCLLNANTEDSQTAAPDVNGFAVVELFTSEGCSSCPPADRVLSDLIEDYSHDGKAVFALSFHVDYWNYLGWKDPFSDAKYSQRQRAYGKALGRPRVYTPQMIVNGRSEFVGSNRGKAVLEVGKALGRSGSVDLKLEIAVQKDNQLVVSYHVEGEAENMLVHLALVESGLIREVSRGENRGRTLSHDNVVRAFNSTELDMLKKGKLPLTIPADVNLHRAQLIGFLQSKEDMHIRGATHLTALH